MTRSSSTNPHTAAGPTARKPAATRKVAAPRKQAARVPAARKQGARKQVARVPAARKQLPRKPLTRTPSPLTSRNRLTTIERSRARRRLSRRNRRLPRPQVPTVFWVIVATVGLLCLIGLIMVLSASSVTSTRQHGTALYYFERQAQWLVVGLVAMFIASRIDYHRLARLGPMLMTGTVVALVLVLFPSPITNSAKGSSRWFDINGVNFQPSELAKLAVILWISTLLHQRRREMADWKRTILPVGVGLAVLGALILAEPDLGTVIMLSVISGVMLVVAGARLDVMAGVGGLGGSILFAISRLGYHKARWDSLDPWKDKMGSGWQSLQSQVGVASGGLLGVGPGASKAKWGFLPEAHTDFIFAIIGEELGLLGCLSVIGAFAVLLASGIRVSRSAPDKLGSLLAIGIATWIGVQAFVNIGVALGVLPNKGVTLPFMSYGGSSLLVTLFTVGVLLNIARQSTDPRVRSKQSSPRPSRARLAN